MAYLFHRHRRSFIRGSVIMFLIYFLVSKLREWEYGSIVNWNSCFSSTHQLTLTNPQIQNGSQLCMIPSLDPFNSDVVHAIKEPKNISCDEHFPLLFKSTLNSTLVPAISAKEFEERNITGCHYTALERKDGSDDGVRMYGRKYPISLGSETKIHNDLEFITIDCKYKPDPGKKSAKFALTDMFAFVPYKKAVNKKYAKARPPSSDRLSVAIFGIDSVSRANFIREMPQSYEYIMKTMGGIEMEGYNKIGDDTFSSIVPMLTSRSRDYVTKSCAKKPRWWFDSCPFIWKDFSKKKYVTSFAEDASKMSIFNGIGSGFRNSPTDYYLRPFAITADKKFGGKQSYVCQGPRLFFETLLDYMIKIAFTMNQNDKAFFHFSWATSLTHDAINSPMLGDRYLKETLEWFKEKNQLNNTILILMSDHGLRWGSVKETDSIQGQLEDRLPFMYFILPEWFKETYPGAYTNLKANTKRLITAHDLHYFLKDLLNTSSIQEDTLRDREIQLYDNFKHNKSLPLGISLFLPIPEERMCHHTMIEENFCVCNKFDRISKTSPIVRAAALFVVNEINLQVSKYYMCKVLNLASIQEAQQRINQTTTEVAYLINFKTNPGGAAFEALVVRGSNSWKLKGSVSRTNKYGAQSKCVTERSVKPFCYCRK